MDAPSSSSSSSIPPSQPQPPQPPLLPEDDGVDCGKKFRRMLRCVERTGDVYQCNKEVHRFLSCERAVFRTALQTDPRSLPGNNTSDRHHISSRPRITIERIPPARADQHNQHSGHGYEDDESFIANTPRTPISVWLPNLFKRAIAKQAQGCTDVAHSLADPKLPLRMFDFSGRVLADVAFSLTVFGERTVSFFQELVDELKRDD